MRRLVTFVAVAVVLGSSSGCGSQGTSSQEVLDDFTDQLVDRGLTRERATCLVDHVADGLDDDGLRAFIDREELSTEERTRLDAADEACREDAG